MSRRPLWARCLVSGIVVIALLANADNPRALARQAHRSPASVSDRPAAAYVRCAKRNVAAGSFTVGDNAPGNGSQFFQSASFAQVIGVDPQGRDFPEMATQVPTLKNGGILNGGKTYVIHLKSGMRWSNGAEITAADAVFGWKMGYDPGGIDPNTGQPGRGCGSSCVIASATARDRYTVVYHLNTIDHVFLEQDIPQFWPTRWPGSWNNDAHVATQVYNSPSFDFAGPSYPTDGPYQIYKVVRDSSGLVTTAYFRPMKYYNIMSCGGYVKTIVFHYFPTLQDELTALKSGKLDLTYDWNLDSLAQMQGPERGYRIHLVPFPYINVLHFNVDARYGGKVNPLHDVRVRQALALALDKRGLITNTYGLNARQTANLIQWALCPTSKKYSTACADRSITGQWDPIAHRYDPNPGKGVALLDAKKLLAQTPWRRGFSLDWLERQGSTIQPPEEASAAASWARLGVKLSVSFASGGTLQMALAHGAFQAGIFTDLIPSRGIDTLLQWELLSSSDPRGTSSPSPTQHNSSGIHDRIIDRAIKTATTTFAAKTRKRNFDIIQEEMAKKGYWDVLNAESYPYTEDGRIQNVSLDSSNAPLWNIWAWKVVRP